MADKEIKFKLVLNNGQFKVEMDEAGKKTDGFGDKVNEAGKKGQRGFKGLLGTLAKFKVQAALVGAAIGMVFVKMGKYALRTASDFEMNQVAFETMLKSADKAKKLLKDITAFTAKTPFQLDDVVKGSKRLLAFGVAGNDVIDTMRKLGDAASGNAQTLDTLTLAYGKIRARGKASMEELNMILEAGVPILDALSESYGVTQAQLFKMVEQGKVSFDDINDALTDLTTGTGQFAGMMQKQSQTLTGMFSTLKDTISLIALKAGQEMLPVFKELTMELQNNKDVTEGLKSMFKAVAKMAMAAAKGIMWFAKQINKIDRILKTRSFDENVKQTERFERNLKNIRSQLDGLEVGSRKYNVLKREEQHAMERLNQLNEKRHGLAMASMGVEEDLTGELNRQINAIDKINTKKAAPVRTTGGKAGKGASAKPGSSRDPAQTTSNYISAAQGLLSGLSGLYDEYYSQQATKVDTWLDRQLSANQAWYDNEKNLLDNSLMNDEEKKKAQAALDEQYAARNELAEQKADKKKRKLQRDQARRMRGIKIAEIVMNTAAGIMQGFAQLGPIGGAIMAVLTTAMGAAQLAMVMTQPLPSLAVGTANVPADTIAQLHAGEGVIPKTFMDSVRAGDLAIGGSRGDIYVTVQGSVVTENELINIIDQAQNDRAQSLGAQNYSYNNPY
jgi:tape measure domain-containing protein